MWFIQLYSKLNQDLKFEFDDSKDQFKIIQVYIVSYYLNLILLIIPTYINILYLFKDFINVECIEKIHLEEELKNYINRNSEVVSKSS